MTTKISTLITTLCDLKRSKKTLESELKSVETHIAGVEKDLLLAMDAEGIMESKSSVGKVTVGESVYPHVEQWDQFAQFILDNGYLHLLERRPAVLAYRELISMGKPVPGVLPYTKRKVTFKES